MNDPIGMTCESLLQKVNKLHLEIADLTATLAKVRNLARIQQATIDALRGEM